jgi:hypothetical protein
MMDSHPLNPRAVTAWERLASHHYPVCVIQHRMWQSQHFDRFSSSALAVHPNLIFILVKTLPNVG